MGIDGSETTMSEYGNVPAYTGYNSILFFLAAYSFVVTGLLLWFLATNYYNDLSDEESNNHSNSDADH